MDLVLVHWTDTVGHGDSAWMTSDEAIDVKPCPMVTIGYLLFDSESYIVVAGTRSIDVDDDTFGNVNSIPKCCVTAVTAICDRNPCQNISQ